MIGVGLDERGEKFLRDQGMFATHSRAQQIQHLENRQDVKERLKAITEENLATWIEAEVFSREGAKSLAVHIMRRFPQATAEEAAEYASVLLGTGGIRFSKALLRADLYYNWRCARRGSVPKDML